MSKVEMKVVVVVTENDPNDVYRAWKAFLDELEALYGVELGQSEYWLFDGRWDTLK